MINFKEMTTEELESSRDQVVIDIMNIKEQLEEYNVLKEYDDENIDKDDHLWAVSAKKAQRVKGHQHQIICKELSERRKGNQVKQTRLPEHFMNVAREELTDEVFHSIFAKAEALRGSNENSY